MEQPIAAILILNTAANTAGAAIAGSQARLLFGEASLIAFSALFTLAVLFFAEIIPKVIGVVYNQPVSRAAGGALDVDCHGHDAADLVHRASHQPAEAKRTACCRRRKRRLRRWRG